MKVICLNNNDVSYILTLGKTYDVFSETETHFLVGYSSTSKDWFYKTRFKPANCENCIDRKCNNCNIVKD